MGSGFYGVPLDTSAKITSETIADYLMNMGSEIKEVVICGNDNREYKVLETQLKTLNNNAA